jgi:hypothetical protein
MNKDVRVRAMEKCMTQLKPRISPTARWLALFISLFIIFLGGCIVIDEYAPARYTRFGFAEALSGVKAKEFGSIIILLGCLPLLLFWRSSGDRIFN